MKKGDKLYCIKNNFNFDETIFIHSAGSFYNILSTTDRYTWMTFNSWVNLDYYNVFYTNIEHVDNIWNYFITEKEARKLKLEKLNEVYM